MIKISECIRIALSWYRFIPKDKMSEEDEKTFKRLQCYRRKKIKEEENYVE